MLLDLLQPGVSPRPVTTQAAIAATTAAVMHSQGFRRSSLTLVITGDLKSKIDTVWNAFWSGGISNPLEVIEQITYLLFIRRLDELQTLKEKKARVTGSIKYRSSCPGSPT